MCGLIKVGDVDLRGWGLFKEPLILKIEVESKTTMGLNFTIKTIEKKQTDRIINLI